MFNTNYLVNLKVSIWMNERAEYIGLEVLKITAPFILIWYFFIEKGLAGISSRYFSEKLSNLFFLS